MDGNARWFKRLALPAMTVLVLMGAGCSNATDGASATADLPSIGQPPAASPNPTPAPPPVAVDATKRIAFQVAMHRLWDDHVTWTRLYIISVAGSQKDKDVTAARLLQNQVDLGNAIRPYYGDAAADQLTVLLKEHINGAVKILDLAKAKDTKKMEAAIVDWRANGDEIAGFLSTANPEAWPLQDMKDAMKMHLDTTLAEATDRLDGNYEQDVKDYDAVKDHIYLMADVLAEGIIKQFPDKF